MQTAPTQPAPSPKKRKAPVLSPASRRDDFRVIVPGSVWMVVSASNVYREYKIERLPDGLHCSCPASVETCRHLRGLLAHFSVPATIVTREMAIDRRVEMPVVDPDSQPSDSDFDEYLAWQAAEDAAWREIEDADPFLNDDYRPFPDCPSGAALPVPEAAVTLEAAWVDVWAAWHEMEAAVRGFGPARDER